MKKLAAVICLGAMTTGAFAQGIINFGNLNSALITSGTMGNPTAISGAAGSYLFALLISNPGANNFTFTGVYATNSAIAAGRIAPRNGLAVPGWGAGVAKDYEVAGWERGLGASFNPSWLNANGTISTSGRPSGLFGISGLGNGVAGGTDSVGDPFPTLPLWGGSTGIQSGFNLVVANVPEPSTMAVAGLGAAALLIFRRRQAH